MIEPTTEQVAPENPMNLNPTGIGGFGDNPQNRNPGGWNKEESISYWYNKLGRMSDEDLAEFTPANQNQKIALLRIQRSLKDDRDSLAEAKEITDRTEGKAPQSVDLTTNGQSINPITSLTTEELRKLAGS